MGGVARGVPRRGRRRPRTPGRFGEAGGRPSVARGVGRGPRGASTSGAEGVEVDAGASSGAASAAAGDADAGGRAASVGEDGEVSRWAALAGVGEPLTAGLEGCRSVVFAGGVVRGARAVGRAARASARRSGRPSCGVGVVGAAAASGSAVASPGSSTRAIRRRCAGAPRVPAGVEAARGVGVGRGVARCAGGGVGGVLRGGRDVSGCAGVEGLRFGEKPKRLLHVDAALPCVKPLNTPKPMVRGAPMPAGASIRRRPRSPGVA